MADFTFGTIGIGASLLFMLFIFGPWVDDVATMKTLDTVRPCQEAGGPIQKVGTTEYVCTSHGWAKIK